MQLEGDDIQEFKKLYEEAFAETITDADAAEMASRVMTLYELLARTLPNERDEQQVTSSDPPASE